MTDITIRNCPDEHLLLAVMSASRTMQTKHKFNTFEIGDKPIIFDTHFTKVGNLIVEYRDA